MTLKKLSTFFTVLKEKKNAWKTLVLGRRSYKCVKRLTWESYKRALTIISCCYVTHVTYIIYLLYVKYLTAFLLTRRSALEEKLLTKFLSSFVSCKRDLQKYSSYLENSFTNRKPHYSGLTEAVFCYDSISNMFKIIWFVNPVEENRAVIGQRSGYRLPHMFLKQLLSLIGIVNLLYLPSPNELSSCYEG